MTNILPQVKCCAKCNQPFDDNHVVDYVRYFCTVYEEKYQRMPNFNEIKDAFTCKNCGYRNTLIMPSRQEIQTREEQYTKNIFMLYIALFLLLMISLAFSWMLQIFFALLIPAVCYDIHMRFNFASTIADESSITPYNARNDFEAISQIEASNAQIKTQHHDSIVQDEIVQCELNNMNRVASDKGLYLSDIDPNTSNSKLNDLHDSEDDERINYCWNCGGDFSPKLVSDYAEYVKNVKSITVATPMSCQNCGYKSYIDPISYNECKEGLHEKNGLKMGICFIVFLLVMFFLNLILRHPVVILFASAMTYVFAALISQDLDERELEIRTNLRWRKNPPHN